MGLAGRRVVAEVWGGPPGARRHHHLATLIGEHLPKASTVKSADLIVERPAFLRRIAKVHVMPDAMEAPQFRIRDEGPVLVSKPAPAATAGATVDVRTTDTGYAMPARAGSLPDPSRVREVLGRR